MKKRLSIIIVLIVAACVAAFAFIAFNKFENNKEHGEINDPVIVNVKPGEVDEDIYKDLTAYAYKGEVLYRNLIFLFKPLDYDSENTVTEYECSVIEDTGNPSELPSIYNVGITNKGMVLEYITGPIEGSFECIYNNGELTVNGVSMEKVPASEIETIMYNSNSHLTN